MGAVRPEDPRDRARRLALRRRLLLWGALPVLLVGILALRWLSLPFVAAGATSGFEEGDADRVVGRSRLLAPINVVERWKAPYDLGTGYAMRGEDDRARPQLEKALRRVDGAPEECAVRANLVLVVERQGAKAEEAGDTATSKARKDEVVAIVDAAPPASVTAAPTRTFRIPRSSGTGRSHHGSGWFSNDCNATNSTLVSAYSAASWTTSSVPNTGCAGELRSNPRAWLVPTTTSRAGMCQR